MNTANHMDGCVTGDWQSNETHHWKVYSKCGTETEKAAHDYNSYTDWSDWEDCADTDHAGQQFQTRTGTCACGKTVEETRYQVKPTDPDPDPEPVAVTGVTLNKTELTLEVEATETLTATVAPEDAANKNVTWSSSDTAVATVNENGVVTAVAAGETTITVTTEDGGKTATCTVTVTEKQPEPCKHTSTKAVDNGDGITHKIVCAAEGCDYVETEREAHTFNGNGVCTVCGAEVVAQIITASRATPKQFTTLQAAIKAARNGDTVEVMKDCAGAVLTDAKSITLHIPEGVTVSNVAGKSYALTLQGKGANMTLTGAGKIQSAGNFNTIQVKKSASLTVDMEGGEIIRTADNNLGAAIYVEGPGGDMTSTSAIQPTSLTVKNGTIRNDKNSAISGNGAAPVGNETRDFRNTKITITGGTITSAESLGIYHPQVGEMTITGGTITGITGIEMRAGTLNVSGDAEITGTSTEYSHNSNNSGTTTIGVGIALSQHVTELPLTAVISGGTITGYHAVVEHDLENDPQSEHVTLKIEGGKFTATGEDNVTVISDNFEKFITGGYFSNDVTNTEETMYVADDYASHPVSTYEGYFHVHHEAQEGWSHDDDGHWTTCVGHEDCLAIVTEKANHIWNDGEVTTEPTYDTEGVRTFTCDTCGHTRTEPIPALERPTPDPDPDPDPTTYYTLTIRYVDAQGNQVAPTVTRRLEEGSRYTVDSPAVEGMTPDQETVTGILNSRTEITVTYAADENVDDNQTPTTEAPETSEPTESTEPTETQKPDETQPPETEEPGETEDLGENDTPLTETPDETEDLGDNDTPLADVPQTGDMLWLWILLAVVSASGLIWISLEEKKGRRVA